MLRKPDTTAKGQYWESAVISVANVLAADHGYGVSELRKRLGLSLILAVLGGQQVAHRIACRALEDLQQFQSIEDAQREAPKPYLRITQQPK